MVSDFMSPSKLDDSSVNPVPRYGVKHLLSVKLVRATFGKITSASCVDISPRVSLELCCIVD